jgi:hypothetical protein
VPTWFLFGFVAFLVLMVVLNLRFFRGVWRKTKDDPGSLDEPWDPFG